MPQIDFPLSSWPSPKGSGCRQHLFLAKALELMDTTKSLGEFYNASAPCLIISLGILLMALGSMQIGGFSIGRMICVLVTLIAAFSLGGPGGAVTGISTGVAMGLISQQYGHLVMSYGLGRPSGGGLFLLWEGGLLQHLHCGQRGQCLGLPAQAWMSIPPYEGLWRHGCFLCSFRLLFYLGPGLAQPMWILTGCWTSKYCGRQAHFASTAMTDIAKTTRAVSDKLTKLSASDIRLQSGGG